MPLRPPGSGRPPELVIGDGSFVTAPGELFPLTYAHDLHGPNGQADPSAGAVHGWVMAQLGGKWRFVDGLGGDLSGYIFPASEMNANYPYLFNTMTFDTLYKNTIFALRDRGFFSASNGFKKLGFIYRDCFKEVNTDFLSWLNQAGVPSSQIVTYGFGCPQGFATPSDIQSAMGVIRRR